MRRHTESYQDGLQVSTNAGFGETVAIDSRFLGWFMIALATIMQLARIVSVTAPHGELPFLSANDRSRWCAIAALTQDGRWEIDKYLEILDSKGKSKIWNTIDMVRHRGDDGVEHSYSSKPPLLTLMYAAICKPITVICGKTLTDDPFLIGRLTMIVANLIPLVLWWLWLQRWIERNVADAWVRWILLNTTLWGTFLTSFVATLNNHLHGAILFTISLALAWEIIQNSQQGRTTSWSAWLSVGISAALTVACELPALAWAAALGGILLFADWKRMLVGFGIGSAAVALAFLGTNFWAHGDWRPPYSHRGLGPLIANVRTSPESSVGGSSEAPAVADVIAAIDTTVHPNLKLSPNSIVTSARLDAVKQILDEATGVRVAAKRTGEGWNIYAWDDWYDYPKSYWLPENKKGVDRGEPDRWSYLMHFTIGHHGVFSLTPIWLWSMVGGAIWIQSGRRALVKHAVDEPYSAGTFKGWVLSERGMAAALMAVTLVCVAFYTSRDVVDRNYAGVCSGFRWLFWMIPAWLWLAVPAIERSSKSRTLRCLVYVALGISVLSATLPWPNPWSHPWPYRLLMWMFPQVYQ